MSHLTPNRAGPHEPYSSPDHRPSAHSAEFVPSARPPWGPPSPAGAALPTNRTLDLSSAPSPTRTAPSVAASNHASHHASHHAHAGHHGHHAPPPAADIYANAALRDAARNEMALLIGRPHPALAVPDTVGSYYAIMPIDSAPSPAFAMSGPPSMLYKGVSVARGAPAALLRIIGPPPAPSAQIVRAGEAWKRVRHPALLCLREVFTTRNFAARAAAAAPIAPANEVVFAYEFVARAETLYNVFLNAPSAEHRYHPLAEPTLWAFATQLLSALAAVHNARLALRDSLSLVRVLVTGRNRLKLSCVGLKDALDPGGADHLPSAAAHARAHNRERVAALQRDDLVAVGHLLATLALRVDHKMVRGGVLACGADVAVDALRRATPYSGDLVGLVSTLLGAAGSGGNGGGGGGRDVTVGDVLGLIGPRVAAELGNVWTHSDAVEAKLFVEFDSSRMFRLLSLLGFVTERGDAGVEPQWAETGDRYLLKLFRDYVFHRVDDDGNPALDMAHVTECLARLDVGSPEQVLLSSRDGGSLLVATYEDLRRCLLQSIDELRGVRQGMPTR